MSSYPTAIEYRGKPRGTVRTAPGVPGRPRRSPGRPPARVRPTYRPAPSPRPSTPVPIRPRPFIPPNIGGWRGIMKGLGPLGIAFETGYFLGSIMFPPRPSGFAIYNPAGWQEFICPNVPGGGTVVGPRTTGYAIVPGSSASNCIGGQNVSGTGTNLRRSWWTKMGPASNTHAHIITFKRNGASITPYPELNVLPQGRPYPVVDPDWLVFPGRAIWYWPGASPMGHPVPDVGPLHWPVRGPDGNVRPLPGVGNEGYFAEQPSNQPDSPPAPDKGPSKGPLPEPFPEKPPKGMKEKKVRASRLVAQLGWAYGQVTEVGDFVDSFHKAIDRECGKRAKPVWDPSLRPRGDDGRSWRWRPGYGWRREVGDYRKPSLAEKASAVYRYWDCVDLTVAAQNVIWNAIEDRLYSLGSRKAKEAAMRDFADGKFRRGYEFGPAI